MEYVKRNWGLWFGVFLFLVGIFFLSGCKAAKGVADFAFGVEERVVVDENGNPVIDPETGKPKTKPVPTDGQSPLGALAALFGFGGLGEALAWAYRRARAKGVDKTLEGVVVGVEGLIRDGFDKKRIYEILKNAQELYGNKDIAAGLIAKIKAEYRKKNPAPAE